MGKKLKVHYLPSEYSDGLLIVCIILVYLKQCSPHFPSKKIDCQPEVKSDLVFHCFCFIFWQQTEGLPIKNTLLILELITFEILAAERLRLMVFDNRLIIDCFANVVNILI